MLKKFKELLDEGYELIYSDYDDVVAWTGNEAEEILIQHSNQLTLKDFLDLLEGEEVEVSLDFITGSITGYFQLIKEEEIWELDS